MPGSGGRPTLGRRVGAPAGTFQQALTQLHSNSVRESEASADAGRTAATVDDSEYDASVTPTASSTDLGLTR